MKKIIIILSLLLTLTTVSAEPVNAGFFDWVKSFFTDEEKSNNSQSQQTQPINDDITITLNQQEYEEEQIKQLVNSNEEYRQHIADIGYECFDIEIENQENFTVQFDLNQSKIDDLSRQYQCGEEIIVEESLVTQIQENGFNSSKIREYESQIDMPYGVYWALAKKYMG